MPYGREDEYTGQEAQEWEILQQNMPNASDEEKSDIRAALKAKGEERRASKQNLTDEQK